MSKTRFWRNETGIVHHVIDWQESLNRLYDFVVETDCGLEYNVHGSVGFTYDPEEPKHTQTHYPTESKNVTTVRGEMITDSNHEEDQDVDDMRIFDGDESWGN